MPASPHTSPSPLRRAALGVLAGTLAGSALALVGAPAATATAASAYPVIATIPLATPVGDGLAVDSTHHKAYVTNPNANTVTVVDLTTDTVTKTIAVGSQPFRIALDEALDRAYVSNTGTQPSPGPGSPIDTISEIDTTTDTVVRTLGGFWAPRGMAVDPTTHKLYVAEYLGGQNLAVVDPTAVPVTTQRSNILESRPWAVDVDPLRHRTYATTLFGGTLSTLSGTSILSTQYGFGGATNVTVDPATQHAYVVANGAAVDLDVSGDEPVRIGNLAASAQPSDVALDPSTGTLLVSNYDNATVSVLDQASGTPVATVPVGTHPVAIDRDPATRRAYVLNNVSQTISVIETPLPQAITFTSTVPTGAHVGDTYTATADGGDSGQPVTFSTSSSGCTVSSAGEVSFTAAGDCVVAAHQAGTSDYAAAPTTTQSVTVTRVATDVALGLAATSTEYGTGTTASTSGTDVPGTVQYTVDGDPVGDPQTVDGYGDTALPDAIGDDLAVGSHQVGAVFTPTDATTYAGSSDSESLTIDKAATTTTFGVTDTEVWTSVERTNTGAGDPTGTVEVFVDGESVGSAVAGAPVHYSVPPGATRNVSAVYSGDSSFAASSASTARKDPILTATVSSASGRHGGWFRSPVTVTFHCTVTSEALTAPCPAPVTLTRNGGGQSVTRTIIASDGGVATRVVDGLDIDRAAPSARLTGVRAGSTYFADGPRVACRATDGLSGLARCTVTRTRSGSRLAWTATAVDKAGNRRTTRVVARSASVWVDGVAQSTGRPVVHEGRTYTVVVESATRPSYLFAAPAPARPAGGNVPFHRIGRNRWALGVTIDRGMALHGLWNLGVRTGSSVRVLQVKVVR